MGGSPDDPCCLKDNSFRNTSQQSKSELMRKSLQLGRVRLRPGATEPIGLLGGRDGENLGQETGMKIKQSFQGRPKMSGKLEALGSQREIRKTSKRQHQSGEATG